MTASNGSRSPIVRLADEESILRHARRRIGLLVASDGLTITRADYAAGEQVARPHIHHQHTDAFYVLDGQLTFQIGGSEPETITLTAGDFVAVPPELAHSFRTSGDQPACWLTIHAPDGGFAAFMRGIRDGVHTEWDIAPVPAEGGLPAGNMIVSLANRQPPHPPTGPADEARAD